MIFDIHTHCFPNALAHRAIAKLSFASGGLKPHTDGTLPSLDALMRQQGVDAFAVQNIATNPGQMKKVNDFAASIQCSHIFPFGSVHPDAPDALEELERIASMGMRGVKLHPDYQDFFVDDPRMFPIYKKAADLGLVILFHAGQDFGYRAPFHCTPNRLARALQHIDGPVIAAHWGGACMGEEVLQYLCGLPLYFDVSFGYGKKPHAEALDIIEKHGTKQLLFGSDCPWHTPEMELRLLDTLELSPSERKDILWNNAAELLKIQ